MPSQFFGQFLLEQGAIRSEALIEVIDRQKAIQRPLCALALERNLLSDDQIHALDSEADDSNANPIRRAVAKRWLSFDRLAELDRSPFEKWMTLGEALLQEGYLTLAELKSLQSMYRTIRTEQVPAWMELAARSTEKDVVAAFLTDMIGVFSKYTGQVLAVDSIEDGPVSPASTWAVSILQEVTGDRHFHLGIGLPRNAAMAVAGNMLKSEVSGLDAMAVDAIMEFVNVVVGNGCSRLGNNGIRLSTRPPVQAAPASLPSCHHATSVRLNSTQGTLDAAFLFLDVPR